MGESALSFVRVTLQAKLPRTVADFWRRWQLSTICLFGVLMQTGCGCAYSAEVCQDSKRTNWDHQLPQSPLFRAPVSTHTVRSCRLKRDNKATAQTEMPITFSLQKSNKREEQMRKTGLRYFVVSVTLERSHIYRNPKPEPTDYISL